ncbi:MAG: DUF2911 domain-containing protein [Saprospiraceae bacterium]|nr:DUF2911 domain-containing protein [Saprospiraceae bacterium]
MKKILFALIFALTATVFTEAQMAPSDLDKSPMDATIFRPGRGEAPIVKVIYSRPQKKNRAVFGNLVPFGKVWRTGANESTELKVYKEIKFGGQTLSPGTYSLFSIPNEDTWTVIVNSDTDMWGAYQYNESNDVIRVEVPSQSSSDTVEAFTILFDKQDETAHLVMAWDDTMVAVPVE